MGDAIIGSYVQSTKGKMTDTKFDSYFWTQFPQNIVRSKMLGQGDNVFDTDNDDDES
jgi:hypothetical protein